jgi:hypothetical protein
MKKVACCSWALVALLSLTGCGNANDLEAPRKFFAEHRSGKSPDYGIFKGLGDDDHVVSVHGFMDDLSICLKLAAKLNEEEPGTYRCAPLNH